MAMEIDWLCVVLPPFPSCAVIEKDHEVPAAAVGAAWPEGIDKVPLAAKDNQAGSPVAEKAAASPSGSGATIVVTVPGPCPGWTEAIEPEAIDGGVFVTFTEKVEDEEPLRGSETVAVKGKDKFEAVVGGAERIDRAPEDAFRDSQAGSPVAENVIGWPPGSDA